MPAWTLSNLPSSVERFNVLAFAPAGRSDFVTHLLLCVEPSTRNDVVSTTRLKVAHMGPPLKIDDSRDVQIAGHIDLTDSQRMQIETFLKERHDELNEFSMTQKAYHYRIHPPFTRPGRDFNQWRFSCVGFVLAAYEFSGVDIIPVDSPMQDLDQIKLAYPDDRLEKEKFRQAMGIGEGSEWPVVYAGYVVNSIARSNSQIVGDSAVPFRPVSGDEYFPSQREQET